MLFRLFCAWLYSSTVKLKLICNSLCTRASPSIYDPDARGRNLDEAHEKKTSTFGYDYNLQSILRQPDLFCDSVYSADE